VLTDDPFVDIPVLGALDPSTAAVFLRQIGEDETAARLGDADQEDLRSVEEGRQRVRWPFSDKPWQYTSHTFGFISPDSTGAIVFAGAAPADKTLRGAAVDITLDRLRVAEYPGGSTHRVLFDFYARNRAGDADEHLHYHVSLRARDGQEAAIIGYPLFVGLNVGDAGVALRCMTVNVMNEADEAFLGFLESDVFRSGLKLASFAQPAVVPLSEMVLGLTKAIAKRHRNVPVQEFYLGLDFSNVPTRARIAEGSYVAVQIPDRLERVWDWAEWTYDNASGHIVSRHDGRTLIPFNYVVLGVSRSSP
jgi:hypothetical protein